MFKDPNSQYFGFTGFTVAGGSNDSWISQITPAWLHSSLETFSIFEQSRSLCPLQCGTSQVSIGQFVRTKCQRMVAEPKFETAKHVDFDALSVQFSALAEC